MIKNDYLFGFVSLTAITLIFFLPVVIGRQSLLEAYPVFYEKHNVAPPQIKTPWVIDGGTQVRTTVPTTRLAVEALKDGHLPLWTPYDGAGENLALGGLYNPIRLLFFTLFDSARAFDWAVVFRFLAAGFGMFLLLKELGLSRMATLFGAVGYMFSGYFAVFLTYFFLDIEAISPWVLWALERYLRRGRSAKLLDIIFPGVLFGLLIVGGQPQSVILHSFFIGGYVLWRIFTDVAFKPQLKMHMRNLVLIFCIALLVALPYIIDFLTLLPQALTIYDYGPSAIFPHGLEAASPLYLLHLFVTPSTILEIAIGGHLFDHFPQIVPYLGVSLILLVLFSLHVPNKPRYVHFFYIFIVLALLKIFGFPFINWIGSLPILKNIGWHKLYGPIALATSVIAAWAFNELPRARIPWKKFFGLLGLIVLAFAVVIIVSPADFWKSYTPHLDFLNRRPETVQAALAALDTLPEFVKTFAMRLIEDGRYFVGLLFARSVVFAGLALFFIFLASKKQKKLGAKLLFLFLVFESFVYIPKVRDGFRYFDPYVEPPFVEFLEERKATEGEFAVISTGYTFPVSLGGLSHIRKFQTTSAVFPKRFWQFMPDTILKNDHDYFKLNAEDISVTPQKFFDAANIQYLLTEASSSPPANHFALVYDKDLRIYENKSVLPRAYVALNKVAASSSADAREKFYSESFDPHYSVVFEDEGRINLDFIYAGETRIQSAEIVSYEPDRVIVQTNVTQDGVLVLADAFYSAWHAYVDGKRADVYPANVLFRGVFVPAGEHTVEFVFEPPFFWPAVFASFLVLLVTLYLLVRRVIANIAKKKDTVAHEH